jgi:Flp pilus assembly protein TadG
MGLLFAVRKMVSRSREAGQSMVEFALVLPLLIIMLLGIIQFGFILNGLVVVNAAAREGARAAAVGEDGEVAARAVCEAALLAGSCGNSNGGFGLDALVVMRNEKMETDTNGEPIGDPDVRFEYKVGVPIILPFLRGGD